MQLSNRTYWIGAALAAGLLAGAYMVTGKAKAADLGGNCCADLEERIAELEATTARKGNRKVTLTISGEISKGVLWWDAGAGGLGPFSNGYQGVGENYNYGSRVRIVGEAKISEHLSAGYLIELGLTDGGFGGFGSTGITVRHNALWVGTPVGRVYLGVTSDAADGIVEVNLANTNVAALNVLAYNNAFDGRRTDLVKWVSPVFAGFELSASRTDDKVWDAALRYTLEMGEFRFAAGIAYTDGISINNPFVTIQAGHRIAGSASVKHMLTGLFLTGAAAQIKLDNGPELNAYSAQGGVERNFFGMGATTLFAEYAKTDDITSALFPAGYLPTWASGPFALLSGTVYGGGVVQSIDGLALDLFADYRRFELDGSGFPAIDVIMAGARIKF